MKFNYKMALAYDGTHYGGWQIQPNSPTIQQILQEKIALVLRSPVTVIGSGRTDAGVHATGQIAHFFHDKDIDLHRFFASINGLLPPDIRLKKVESAPTDFHAQHSAVAKTYHYYLRLNSVWDPFTRLYRLHVREKLDLSLLTEAAALFVGTHDFTSFTNEVHKGSAAHDPVRTLYRLDLVPIEEGLRLEFEGDGFLYKMVRNIVGTLLEIACGKRRIDEVPLIFEAKDRRRAGKAAAAHGLFLIDVKYPD